MLTRVGHKGIIGGMRPRSSWIRAAAGACALLVLFAAGCSLFRPKTVLSVFNNKALPIVHVYVYPVGGSSALDVLAGGTINPGATQQFLGQSYAAGGYTVRAGFSDGTYTNYTVVFDGNPYTLSAS